MSTLFGSGGLFGNGTTSILSQWASIRNGSYKKLMTAYYGKQKTSSSSDDDSKKNDKVTEKTLTATEENAQGLKSAADDLTATGSKSVFKKVTTKDEDGKTIQDYDKNKIYKAVKKFVDNYNKVIGDTNKTINSGVSNNRKSMIAATNANEERLSKMGITIKADNTLEIDEEAFKKADMSQVEEMFNGRNSYGYQVSTRASLIGYYAGREADTYNKNGNYNSYNSGMNFNSWF
ncbi:MAG: flagellar filament capping protein FliD [Lachnospiraceae bacterium]|nr:flagellar filament capping protein FliD [Lachnospiraceae bacterium]